MKIGNGKSVLNCVKSAVKSNEMGKICKKIGKLYKEWRKSARKQ